MNNSWKIYILTLISFIVGTSQFIIVGILDKIAASIGVSISTAGQLVTVFALANCIGTPILIMLTSKLDKRKQLVMALIIIIAGVLVIGTSSSFYLLILARIILGIGSGVFVVSAYGTAAKLAPIGKQGSAMSNISMGFSSSLIFGVPIGRLIASIYDWRIIFWLLGALSFVAIFILLKTLPSFESEIPVPLTEQLAFLKRPIITFTLCVTFFTFTGYSLVNTYITPLLKTVLSANEMSPVLFIFGIVSLMGSKTGGKLSDEIGTARTLIGSMSFQITALVLLTVFSGIKIPTIILLAIFEAATWTFGPTQNYNLVSLAPEASGIILSLNSSFVQFGFATGAAIGGIAIEKSSIISITWIGAVSVAIACLIGINLKKNAGKQYA